MSHTHRRVLASLIVAATVAAGSVTAAFAQSDAPGATPDKAEVKAQHKAASKARRAHKNAELKKLENNGYNPATNDPKYPDKLQNAEKKADGQ